MKKILILLFLTGCSLDIEYWQITKAKELCKDQEVVQYTIYPIALYAICKDGKSFHINKEYK